MKLQVEQVLRDVLGAWWQAQALPPAEMPAVIVTVPKDKTHGDFACATVMAIAKKLGRDARALAAELAVAVTARLAGIGACAVAGPGFLNVTLAADAGLRVFARLLERGDQIGFSRHGNGTRVNVEYVSANPTGPLTVGHGRNAAVGDIVANLLSAVGYEVTREYYFNDAGNQMNVLARSVRTRYRQLLGSAEQLEENGYQGDYIIDIAKTVRQEHGDGLCDSDDLAVFKKYAVDATFAMIKATLERMGVRHDIYFNEHALYTDGKIEATLNEIAARGLSYAQDGAIWFRATQFGAEKDRVLVKSTGEPTYRLPDIAYHREKFARGYDWMIDVFGADHMTTYPDVLACLSALGYPADHVTVLIHQFVTIVQHGEIVKMSTRKANYVTLDELMDEVGVDATRYFFVMRKLGSHFEFDLDLAKKQSLDNPVFYVQYAHARICSVLRHCAEAKPHLRPETLTPATVNGALLAAEEEQDLVRHLAQFDDTVLQAAHACEPHRITAYLEKLAELFHRYYNQHQIVVADDALAAARMALALMTRHAVRNGLKILGVTAPEKM
jgi:arginyl-tRNA synthetase